MPKLKLNLPRQTPWTRVPNDPIDRLMPQLGDTELRVLLVLLRETAGRNRSEQTMSITYRELMERTGRKSEALARALTSPRIRALVYSTYDSHPTTTMSYAADRSSLRS